MTTYLFYASCFILGFFLEEWVILGCRWVESKRRRPAKTLPKVGIDQYKVTDEDAKNFYHWVE